ncbi:discoidin domain-containing protein [Mucilaginibacter sp. RB4R14]|uniref:discoidin domain-containing protein n=1 Tax=Mucilaginibacter aurantiaciroseus TaxID=2949308 RepID=UPI002091542B|nr:discoidin domain-containing protein [Mucilaginibacter aurantiaciroseus]MCO5936668.1 discoidin domain-containing protein [Mucilaginibacter aurantiaciroseus]
MNPLLKKTLTLGFASSMLLSCQKGQLPSGKADVANQPGINTKTVRLNATAVNYSTIITKQINFILAGQLPSGAMMNTSVPGSRICGYFGNIACLGVLEAPTATNQTAVKNWMIWYMGKLNGTTNPVTGKSEVAGSIYDYAGSAETTNGTYDSVDSYASTFLMLAKRYGELSAANRTWLAGYSYQLTLIGNALMGCMDNSSNSIPTLYTPDDNDWLTIDSYVHGAKNLMDNAETNQGLKAMVWLQSNVITNGNPAYYSSVLTSNTSGIESQLWRTTMYNWNDNGTTGATMSNWATWYPDAVSQLYPAMFDVIAPTSARAASLYGTFNTKYATWSTGFVNDPSGFPWAAVSYASAKMSDFSRTNSYLTYLDSFAGTTQPNNWYNLEAGFAILAAKIASTAPVNLALSKTATASSNTTSAGNSNDGDLGTRWSSAVADNEWWKVDLGSNKTVSKVIIRWEGAYDTNYSIQTSVDDVTYTNAYNTTIGDGGDDVITFNATTARYVKILCTTRVQPLWGSSFWEVEAY